ncbi:MAG: hypothetical protein K6E14_10940 [Paludibacteraceae bacterium]|nr:hypothetical protein [Paludibacteraceae bacterium]
MPHRSIASVAHGLSVFFRLKNSDMTGHWLHSMDPPVDILSTYSIPFTTADGV